MSVKNSVYAVSLATFDSAVLDDSYEAINVGGLPEACFLVRITNATDVGLTISLDGVHDHEYIAAAAVIDLPVQTNSQPNNKTALWQKGQIFYVNGTDATGNIYLSGYYQPVAN